MGEECCGHDHASDGHAHVKKGVPDSPVLEAELFLIEDPPEEDSENSKTWKIGSPHILIPAAFAVAVVALLLAVVVQSVIFDQIKDEIKKDLGIYELSLIHI